MPAAISEPANKTSGFRQRIKAGFKRAVAQGVKLGRPKIDSATERKVRKQLAKGVGILKVAKSLGIGTGTVQRRRLAEGSTTILCSAEMAPRAALAHRRSSEAGHQVHETPSHRSGVEDLHSAEFLRPDVPEHDCGHEQMMSLAGRWMR
jgi:hypothetical protein